MENYDDISKCSTTDLQMLTMVYMFDQGSANIKKIAEWLSTTEDLAEKALAEFKGTEAYDKYYALVSRYLNEYNGRQSSELLSRCAEEIAGLLKTFNILSDRDVSALTILNEGYAERMLKSDYCQKEFGKDLSGLKRGLLSGSSLRYMRRQSRIIEVFTRGTTLVKMCRNLSKHIKQPLDRTT